MAGVEKKSGVRKRPLFLGIEAGGTRTVALLEDRDGVYSRRIEAGPANLRLLDDGQLTRHFRGIARAHAKPDALAIGMAGARTEADRERMRRAAAKAWPGVPCYATNDLETALMTADDSTRSALGQLPRVLVLSGTGSCCLGRMPDGRTA